MLEQELSITSTSAPSLTDTVLAYYQKLECLVFSGKDAYDGAGKKGLRHVLHFIASAFRFYNQYGWKLL